MQIKYLEYAIVIAETRSITRAAKKLFISQQALSEALKLLENELNFTVFERSNRGVVPTAEGEKFLNDLQVILPMVHGWQELAKAQNEQKTIKIFVQYVLDELLLDSKFTSPIEKIKLDAKIEWETANAMEILEKAETNSFDIGLLQIDSKTEMDEKLKHISNKYFVKQLCTSKMAVVLRADDILAEKENLQLEDLAGKTLVVNRIFGHTPKIQQLIDKTSVKEIYLPQSINVFEYILKNANTVTYLPKVVVEENIHVKKGNLIIRDIGEDKHIFHLIYQKKATQEQKQIIKLIEKYFA